MQLEPARRTAGGVEAKYVRRRPTLPQPLGCSTIGAERLNFRVRDGTGCFPFAMAAVTLAVTTAPGCARGLFPSHYSFVRPGGVGARMCVLVLDCGREAFCRFC